jgi:hypothetical protein
MEVPGQRKGLEVGFAKGHNNLEEQYFQVFGKGMLVGLVLGILLVQVSKVVLQGFRNKGKDTGVNVEVNVNVPKETVKAEQNKEAKVLSPKSRVEVHNMKVHYDQFTVEVLKEFCRQRGLKVGGLKKDLVERLQEADWAEGR